MHGQTYEEERTPEPEPRNRDACDRPLSLIQEIWDKICKVVVVHG
jgi:hypothetical protein